MRWRSKEYREAYPNLVDKSNNRTLPEVTVGSKSNRDVGADVRKSTDKFAKETTATVMNAADMPRRLIAATTNDDYSYKDAIQFFGTQPYKSVVGDEYAKENPKTAMAADIGAGLLAWNLPGITRSIAKTGAANMRNAAKLAQHADDVAAVNATPYIQRAKVVKDLNANVKNASGSTPVNQDVRPVINGITNKGQAIPATTTKGGSNMSTYSKSGQVSKGTGSKSQGSGK
jgi:hypothetical protein